MPLEESDLNDDLHDNDHDHNGDNDHNEEREEKREGEGEEKEEREEREEREEKEEKEEKEFQFFDSFSTTDHFSVRSDGAMINEKMVMEMREELQFLLNTMSADVLRVKTLEQQITSISSSSLKIIDHIVILSSSFLSLFIYFFIY